MTGISVVAPCLNEEACLPAFLDSLRRQWRIWCAPYGIELILVDGGSVDGSRTIAEGCHDWIPTTILTDSTRNLGYIRNLGAEFAQEELLLFTNSDATFPPWFLWRIGWEFSLHPSLQALSGRTKTIDGGFLASAGYFCFDMLRWLFANKLRRFSPSGNFLAIRRELFMKLGGFPEVKVNEDGLLGKRISEYCRSTGTRAWFSWHLWAGHHAKRFRKKGGLRTLLFYFYVFGNFTSSLRYILKAIQRRAEEGY